MNLSFSRMARRQWMLPMVWMGLAVCSSAAPAEFTQESLAAIYAQLSPAIGLVEYSVEITNESDGESAKRDSNAPGLVVAPSGLVMTHGHLLRQNARPFNISVTLGAGPEKKKYEAVLLDKPRDVNIVFLRLKSDTPLQLQAVRFAPAEGLALGSPVALVGMLGEAFDYARSIQEARVSAILDKPRRAYCLDQMVRFGYVGGPVADSEGRVVGVVGYDLSREEGGELYTRSGNPLIFQANLFQKYIDSPPGEPKEGPAGGEAWLGVITQALTDDFVRYWKLPQDTGILVSTVVEGSPAESVGLRPGDIITEFNGTTVRAKADEDVPGFSKMIRDTGENKEVELKVLREGQNLSMRATLGTRPRSAREAEEYSDPYFGLTVRELTADLRIRLNLPEDVQGVIVRRIESGSVAQLGKMRPGIIILGVAGQAVHSIEEFKAALEKIAADRPKEVPIFARAGAATGFFRLEPRWDEGK